MKVFAALLSLSASLAFYLVMIQNSSSAPSKIKGPDWIYARI